MIPDISGQFGAEWARSLRRAHPCCCEDCECHDRAEQRYEADPVEDLPGGWLCWNCSIGQHHEHDPLWCAP